MNHNNQLFSRQRVVVVSSARALNRRCARLLACVYFTLDHACAFVWVCWNAKCAKSVITSSVEYSGAATKRVLIEVAAARCERVVNWPWFDFDSSECVHTVCIRTPNNALKIDMNGIALSRNQFSSGLFLSHRVAFSSLKSMSRLVAMSRATQPLPPSVPRKFAANRKKPK